MPSFDQAGRTPGRHSDDTDGNRNLSVIRADTLKPAELCRAQQASSAAAGQGIRKQDLATPNSGSPKTALVQGVPAVSDFWVKTVPAP
jgi:hypothetical protein